MLLWRRAIGDELGKIFCLVRADLLNYDISVKAEQELAQLMKGKSGKCTELKKWGGDFWVPHCSTSWKYPPCFMLHMRRMIKLSPLDDMLGYVNTCLNLMESTHLHIFLQTEKKKKKTPSISTMSILHNIKYAVTLRI